jgi:murein DD-endopeptidase MepM/ murein hydrolase activator NlpD
MPSTAPTAAGLSTVQRSVPHETGHTIHSDDVKDRQLLRLLAALLAVPPLLLLLGGTATGATEDDPVGRWPLVPQPVVVHPFDPPSVTWGSGHRGVDLAGAVGQPVHAALPGVVTFTGRIAGVRIVVVDHGATRTTYQPVAASVPRGARVSAGQVIGHLEWFGTHCSPAACLHWGWIRGSEYLDPLDLVGPFPVRLLPLDTVGPVVPVVPVVPRLSSAPPLRLTHPSYAPPPYLP